MKEVVKEIPSDTYVMYSSLLSGTPKKAYLVVWGGDYFKLVTNKQQKYQFSCISNTTTYCSSFNKHDSYVDAIAEIYRNYHIDMIKIYEFDDDVELLSYVVKQLRGIK